VDQLPAHPPRPVTEDSRRSRQRYSGAVGDVLQRYL
jgi:hypothetical protein